MKVTDKCFHFLCDSKTHLFNYELICYNTKRSRNRSEEEGQNFMLPPASRPSPKMVIIFLDGFSVCFACHTLRRLTWRQPGCFMVNFFSTKSNFALHTKKKMVFIFNWRNEMFIKPGSTLSKQETKQRKNIWKKPFGLKKKRGQKRGECGGEEEMKQSCNIKNGATETTVRGISWVTTS